MALSKTELQGKVDYYHSNLFWKVKLYLADNSKNIDDFDIVIVPLADGTAAKTISVWDELTGLSKPGSTELDPFDAAATAEFTAFALGVDRRDNGYPDVGEQLDLLYKDMTAGKLDTTGEWHKLIKKVKEVDYPKS